MRPVAAPEGVSLVMATQALGYAPGDPIGLVESCYRAIERILATHTAKGVLIPRPWVDHPCGEEEITLSELGVVASSQPGVTGPPDGRMKGGTHSLKAGRA
jgi:hypothetical protein